jgi:hypothetical protein
MILERRHRSTELRITTKELQWEPIAGPRQHGSSEEEVNLRPKGRLDATPAFIPDGVGK